jgi:hypothetical protein
MIYIEKTMYIYISYTYMYVYIYIRYYIYMLIYVYIYIIIYIYAFITNNFQGNPSSRFIPSFVGADKSEPQLRGMPPGCHWTRVFFPRRNGGFLAVILRICIYIYDVKNKYIYI